VFHEFKADLKLLTQYSQLLPLCFAVFVSMIGFGLVMPLLPIYARDFGATGTQLGFLTASFAVTRAVVTYPGGWLADKSGRKTPVAMGLLTYSVVMALYGFSQDIHQLIFFRALQGVASGVVWPIISTMIADMTLPSDRSKALGLYEMMHYLGLVVGPGLGGTLAGAFTISVPFFVCSFLAFLTLGLVVFTVKETRKETGLVTTGSTEAQTSSNLSEVSDGSAITLRFTRLTPYPRVFIGLCMAGFTISFSNSLVHPVLSVFANEELGISVINVGLLFTAMSIITLLTTLPLGTTADRTGRKSILSVGIVLSAISAVSIPVSGSFWPLLLIMMLRGLGRAAANPSLTAMFANLVPLANRGKSMGVFNGVRNIGLVVGSTLGGFLYEVASSQTPFLICALVSLMGALVVLLTVSEPREGLA
jgi:MFS family permease